MNNLNAYRKLGFRQPWLEHSFDGGITDSAFAEVLMALSIQCSDLMRMDGGVNTLKDCCSEEILDIIEE